MKRIFYILPILAIVSCKNEADYDAQGVFEATEIVISSEATGRILAFDVTEGSVIAAGEVVGSVDSMQLHLQRNQLKAQQQALLSSRPDKEKQVAALRKQISAQKNELTRVENMLRDGAATRKQHDDLKSQIDILEGQLSATLSNIDNNTLSINENAAALEAQISALDDRISKCRIASAVGGTVLVKYAQAGEFTTSGKPLMKVADLDDIYLRAYFTSDQLSKVNLGDEVTVIADFGADERYSYPGRVVWISAENEFTPKSIQTKDTRANLVYAAKIAVRNDGRLKIGLAGEVKL
ncbi:MAG: HlyD family secretion protein [Candidatus Cryptobacteroides sp.]